MEDNVQLKRGEEIFVLRMKDGSKKKVAGKRLSPDFHYHKENGLYWMTKTSSGVLITSARTIKALKELTAEPEFFDKELTPERIIQAVNRWGNKYKWKV